MEYIRVPLTITNVYTAVDRDMYVSNMSTIPVNFIVTEPALVDSVQEKDLFASLGGSAGMVYIPHGKCLVATSISEDTEALIIISDSKSIVDSENREALDELITQVIRLSDRVSKNELDILDRKINYLVFLGKFEDTMLITHTSITKIINTIFEIQAKLIDFDRYVYHHSTKASIMEYDIARLKATGLNADTLQDLKLDMSSLRVALENVTRQVNQVLPDITDNIVNIKEVMDKHVTPMKTQLTKLNDDFTYINDAFVRLSTMDTLEELEAEYMDLIKTVPADMDGPLTEVKNMLVDIMLNKDKNVEQDTALETKIDYEDSVIMDPNAKKDELLAMLPKAN